MGAETHSVSSALSLALAKLVAVVEEENTELGRQSVISHADYVDRKNQVLRELMAAQRRESIPADRGELRSMLNRLAQALQLNSRLLKHHIAAVGEISDILVSNLRDMESDGTYSRDRGAQHGR